jgi:hypothetical protein
LSSNEEIHLIDKSQTTKYFEKETIQRLKY